MDTNTSQEQIMIEVKACLKSLLKREGQVILDRRDRNYQRSINEMVTIIVAVGKIKFI